MIKKTSENIVYIGEKRELSTTCIEKVGKFINRIDIIGKFKILKRKSPR